MIKAIWSLLLMALSDWLVHCNPYVESGTIKHGTMLKITFLGKRKNKTNANFSDNWSVKPMRIDLSAAG